MTIRVIRLLEYTYPDVDTAAQDMEHWAVQGAMRIGPDRAIRSSVLLNAVPYEDPYPVTEEKYVKVHAGLGIISIVRSALVKCGDPHRHDFHYWEAERNEKPGVPAGTYICADIVEEK